MTQVSEKQEMYKEITERIFVYIDEKNMKDVELAKALNVSKQHVSVWRNKKTNIGGKSLIDLLIVFNDLNPGWLIFGTGDMIAESKDIKEELIRDRNFLRSENEELIAQIDIYKRENEIHLDHIILMKEKVKRLEGRIDELTIVKERQTKE